MITSTNKREKNSSFYPITFKAYLCAVEEKLKSQKLC